MYIEVSQEKNYTDRELKNLLYLITSIHVKVPYLLIKFEESDSIKVIYNIEDLLQLIQKEKIKTIVFKEEYMILYNSSDSFKLAYLNSISPTILQVLLELTGN